MAELIEVKGLNELMARMQKYPVELHKGMSLTVSSSLLVLWENVPPYPPPPEDSQYARTGTLGKSLGSDISGGAGSEPDIYSVRPLGATGYEGKFGSRLSYASYVIGDAYKLGADNNGTQARQHQGRWWTMKTIATKSAEKINRLWNQLGEKMARFLEGKANG
jgi:hypothetical protein